MSRSIPLFLARRIFLTGFAAFVLAVPGLPGAAISGQPGEDLAECTYTQGYWKNHSGAWPLTDIMLGTVSYTQAQVLQIYAQPVAGNGLIKLAHQLSAAKLNIAQGADAPAEVAQAITDSDNLIGALVVPPIGGGSLSNAAVDALNILLTDFNEGVIGPGHCGVVPVQPTTWSGLKARHRG